MHAASEAPAPVEDPSKMTTRATEMTLQIRKKVTYSPHTRSRSFLFPSPIGFAHIRRVKFAASLLFLAFLLAACNTPATRRDLYAPNKSNGPYTRWYREGGKWPYPHAPSTPAPELVPSTPLAR
jgi:hypothetical protein